MAIFDAKVLETSRVTLTGATAIPSFANAATKDAEVIPRPLDRVFSGEAIPSHQNGVIKDANVLPREVFFRFFASQFIAGFSNTVITDANVIQRIRKLEGGEDDTVDLTRFGANMISQIPLPFIPPSAVGIVRSARGLTGGKSHPTGGKF